MISSAPCRPQRWWLCCHCFCHNLVPNFRALVRHPQCPQSSHCDLSHEMLQDTWEWNAIAESAKLRNGHNSRDQHNTPLLECWEWHLCGTCAPVRTQHSCMHLEKEKETLYMTRDKTRKDKTEETGTDFWVCNHVATTTANTSEHPDVIWTLWRRTGEVQNMKKPVQK